MDSSCIVVALTYRSPLVLICKKDSGTLCRQRLPNTAFSLNLLVFLWALNVLDAWNWLQSCKKVYCLT